MRRKRFFLFVVTAIMALLVKADDFMVDGIYYKMINDEEIAVISHPAYLSYEGEIVIPENISGYNVTRISESAFFGCNKLTSIELPNTIQRIETGAFYNCSKLKKMNVPEDLYYIGDVAFMFDTLLIDFSIPETVTHIGERAFAYCMSMTSVKIPESVTFIGEYPFVGCSSIKKMSVEKGNKYYDSRNGCNAIIETASNRLICGCQSSIVPDGITRIEENAFCGSAIKSLVIPNSVKSIGTSAFMWCGELTDIVLPESLMRIESATFRDCAKLSSITMPKNVSFIGYSAFNGCESLSEVVIPAEIAYIDAFAFSNTGITTLQLDAVLPPVLIDNIIDEPGAVKLIVPVGSINEYKGSMFWNCFLDIVENKEEDPSGINGVCSDNKKGVMIYTIDGRRVTDMRHSGLYVKDGKKIIRN